MQPKDAEHAVNNGGHFQQSLHASLRDCWGQDKHPEDAEKLGFQSLT